MYEDEFPLRLAQLRQQKGVSARDMSLSIGQNAGYINNIESGKALPSMSNFFYICEYPSQIQLLCNLHRSLLSVNCILHEVAESLHLSNHPGSHHRQAHGTYEEGKH